MYKRSRIVLVILLASFGSEVVVVSAIIVLSYEHFDGMCYICPEDLHSSLNTIQYYVPLDFQKPITACVPHNISRYFYAFWFPIIAFDCVVCVLALSVSIRHIRRMRAVNYWTQNTVWNVLLKDSILYFVMWAYYRTTLVANWSRDSTLSTYIANAVIRFTLPVSFCDHLSLSIPFKLTYRGYIFHSSSPRGSNFRKDFAFLLHVSWVVAWCSTSAKRTISLLRSWTTPS